MRKLHLVWAFLRVQLPEWAKRALYSGRLPVVDGRQIDASAQAVCDLVRLVRVPGETPSLAESRAQIEMMAARFDLPTPASVRKSDITLPGAEGPRPARLYMPQGAEQAPLLLYLHGGGWVQGSLDSHDGLCGKLAARSGLRVVSYDYRLAPEHRFPAAPEDVLACYRALVAGETDIAVTPGRLAVGGDSAGANLAAALMHDLAEAALPLPAAQLLLYPAVDARMTSRSMQALHDQPLLPVLRMKWYLDQYLPETQDRLAPRVSPLFSPNLAGQPPAMIVSAGQDPLWDDGQIYAQALQNAGVEVAQADYPGQVHAFASLCKIIPQGNEAVYKCAAWLKQVFA
ncbi:alpha/beta hydrolase [Lutimaribacter sp. EGI FJ00015]|uniref:Alpha/beta hydrolase n=1 Tax=Lutimaribacter degradans TaxID=2945989 RepID=A0ACC5ZWV0_9RHOB|nr:alpha/beta hydrolase [Lutimaribacter sp. EGI FJ00013]MCM2562796.1 alpha/beta hydrolase [Lutimaribacter sp. EGI FJ00013]MCO0613953.1 alpha/beta hydrolase [Lutimaribacter sp. EGI FJ00015]MCO0636925.1 alpha/beta hydrolase [Lutimaribacter sp. EGI FJ00014]